MQSPLRQKSVQLSLITIELVRKFGGDSRFRPLFNQLLRSSASIGSNIQEAINAYSKPDFVHKLRISQKECSETLYWINLLNQSQIVKAEELVEMKSLAQEILKMLRSSIITSRKNSLL